MTKLLTILLLVNLMTPLEGHVSYAANPLMVWRQRDLMDMNLNIVNNKTGDDDLLFEIEMAETGRYTLEYYLEDGKKTTMYLDNNYDKFIFNYKVEEYGTPATNITQAMMNNSFLDIDYTAQVPVWQANTTKQVDPADGLLKYKLERAASTKYPGIAFNIANHKVLVKWDFRAKKLYVYFDHYQPGKLMPVNLVTPSGKQEKLVTLKKLDGFDVVPTHLIKNPSGGGNVELTPIVVPTTSSPAETPGSRPGIRLNFKRPQSLNPADWTYDYAGNDLDKVDAIFELKDLAGPDYLDVKFSLDTANTGIYSLPAGNGADGSIAYQYDSVSHMYSLDFVKDKTGLNDLNKIVEWQELEASKIYTTGLSLEIKAGTTGLDGYEFKPFKPENNFAYTYMEYTIKRADQREAYLEITPYDIGDDQEVEYTILYSKSYQPQLTELNHLWLKHYEKNSDKQRKINIPVPFNAASSQDYYQVLVSFAGTKIRSQLLNYQAQNDLNVPPPTPVIRTIDNVYVIPSQTVGDKMPTKIQMDMAWEAPDNQTIKELDTIFENKDGNSANDRIYYEVMVNNTPEDTVANPYQVIKVYEVYKDGATGKYHVRIHPSLTANQDVPSDLGDYSQGYNSLEQLFRMEKIVIYDSAIAGNQKWTKRLTTNFDATTPSSYTVTETTGQANFEFPGVNYFKIRGVTEKDGRLSASRRSVPYSLSLSLIDYQLPIVDQITYEPAYPAGSVKPEGVLLTWKAVDISLYEKYMVTPLNKKVSNQTYRVFIAKKKEELLKDLSNLTNFSGPLPLVANNRIEFDKSQVEDLDNGKVYYFERDQLSADDLKTVLTGLHPNGVYYLRWIVDVTIEDNTGGNLTHRQGDLSKVLEMTVPIDIEEPGDDELTPLVPENLEASFYDDEKLNVKLSWDLPKGVKLSQDSYGFEVIAIEDEQLADKWKGRKVSLTKLLAEPSLIKKGLKAYRLYHDGTMIRVQQHVKGVWINLPFNRYEYDGKQVILYDTDNSPNRVIYYYVRSAKMKGATPINQSLWAEATITTTPIKGPINLIVDYDSNYQYEKKHETIIRFDAPIPSNASLLTDYVPEIFIRGEDDADYSATNYRRFYLGSVSGAPDGYQRLYYRISELKSGKSYTIKVRLEDRTKGLETLPNGEKHYPKSAFSNKVVTRTQFDQHDYDKEQKYKEYLDYYMKKGQELKKRPYFDLSRYSGRDKGKGIVKYRGPHAAGEMAGAAGGRYQLIDILPRLADKKMPNRLSVDYYFPAELIQASNDEATALELVVDGQRLIIRPDSLGVESTEAIQAMIEDLHSHSTGAKDYELRLSVNLGNYPYSIQGQKALQPFVNLQLSVIGKRVAEENLDNQLAQAVDDALQNNKYLVIKGLEKELAKGINERDLYAVIEEVLVKVEEDVARVGYNRMMATLQPTSREVKELAKPMVISLAPRGGGVYTDIAVRQVAIYQKKGTNWRVQRLVSGYDQPTIKTTSIAAYVATMNKAAVVINQYVTPAEQAAINRYQLDRLYTPDDFRNKNKAIRGDQLMKTLALVMGATDPNAGRRYLSEQGLDLPATSEYGQIDKQIAYYLYFQIYCHKRGIDSSQVAVKDYLAIEDRAMIDSSYRLPLTKAAGLKVFDLNNGYLYPQQSTTMADILNFLRHDG